MDSKRDPGVGGITRRAVLGTAGAAAVGRMMTRCASGPGTTVTRPGAAASRTAPTTYEVGSFLLRLTTGAAPALQITHREEPDRVVWQSPGSGGFLHLGTAETVVEENTTAASGFTVSDRNLVRYAQQSVDSATMHAGSLVLEGAVARILGASIDYTMTFSSAGHRRLRFRVQPAPTASVRADRIFLRYDSDATEAFWGFGAQMTRFNQKGRLLPILVQEQGVGRGLPVITRLVSLLYGPRTAGNWATTSISPPHWPRHRSRSPRSGCRTGAA